MARRRAPKQQVHPLVTLIILAIAGLIWLAIEASGAGSRGSYVRGYTRSDGMHVSGYTRH